MTASTTEKEGRFRLLHTMIRVKDLDKSIDFYTRLLGMKLLRKNDFSGGRFTLAFVGYGDESNTAVVELTHNWDQEEAVRPWRWLRSPRVGRARYLWDVRAIGS